MFGMYNSRRSILRARISFHKRKTVGAFDSRCPQPKAVKWTDVSFFVSINAANSLRISDRRFRSNHVVELLAHRYGISDRNYITRARTVNRPKTTANDGYGDGKPRGNICLIGNIKGPPLKRSTETTEAVFIDFGTDRRAKEENRFRDLNAGGGKTK